jgi:hypothetical protein
MFKYYFHLFRLQKANELNYIFSFQMQIFEKLKHRPTTEHRVRVVNTPASYSGGPGFKSQPGYLLS